MITNEKAFQLAKEFCRSKGEIAANIYYDVEEPADIGDYFCFDFKIVDKDGNPPNEMVGGAPGFTISKHSGAVEIIGWERYREIKNKKG